VHFLTASTNHAIKLNFIFPASICCRLKYSGTQAQTENWIMIRVAPSGIYTANETLQKRLWTTANIHPGPHLFPVGAADSIVKFFKQHSLP
jgi:hypothetical protein